MYAWTGRFSADTIPDVTVPCRPSGEPIAITGSPTASLSESPSWATVSLLFGTLMTARSLVGSCPTIRASAVSSLVKVTTILALLSPIAAEMTPHVVRPVVEVLVVARVRDQRAGGGFCVLLGDDLFGSVAAEHRAAAQPEA